MQTNGLRTFVTATQLLVIAAVVADVQLIA